MCLCVRERERNPMLFKEKIYRHGEKKKTRNVKKSVCYSKPYHLEKITANILPNITDSFYLFHFYTDFPIQFMDNV